MQADDTTCQKCHKGFSTKSNLTKHIRKDSCKKKQGVDYYYPCQMCSYFAKSLSNLHTHGNHVHKNQIDEFRDQCARDAEMRRAQLKVNRRSHQTRPSMQTHSEEAETDANSRPVMTTSTHSTSRATNKDGVPLRGNVSITFYVYILLSI